MFKTSFKTVLGIGAAVLLIGAAGGALVLGTMFGIETFYSKPNEQRDFQLALFKANCGVLEDAFPPLNSGRLSEAAIAELRTLKAQRDVAAAASSSETPIRAKPPSPQEQAQLTAAFEEEQRRRETEERERKRGEAVTMMMQACSRLS